MDYLGGGGGQRVCCPPPSQIIGGPAPPPSSYAYAEDQSHYKRSYSIVTLLLIKINPKAQSYWSLDDELSIISQVNSLTDPGNQLLFF